MPRLAPVDERIRFIQDALSDRFTMSQCARGTASAAASGTNGWRATTRKVGAASTTAVARRTAAPIASTRRSRSSSVGCGGSPRSGARASSCASSRRAIPACRGGLPRAPRRTCSRATASCCGGAAVARSSIPGSCRHDGRSERVLLGVVTRPPIGSHGVHGVAGSNPAVPTDEDQASRRLGMWGFFLGRRSLGKSDEQ
jgi:hypothetical protein